MPRPRRQQNIVTGALPLFLLAGAGCYFLLQLSAVVLWVGLLGIVVIIILVGHPVALSSPRHSGQAPKSFRGLSRTAGSGPGRFNHPPAIGNGTDLTTKLEALDSFQLEKLVAAVFRKRGYTIARF